jgi:capsular polysaccharide export protein
MNLEYEASKIDRARQASTSIHFALKMLTPDVVAIWNNLSFGGRLMDLYTEAARYYFERGPLPATVQFSRRGVNADLQTAKDGDKYANESAVVTARDWIDEYKRRVHKVWTDYPSPSKPREEITMSKGDRPIVLFVGQVAYDTQIVWHSPYGYNYSTVYDELRQHWDYNSSDYQLVIKSHPVDLYPAVHRKATSIPGAAHVCNGDIREYLDDGRIERVLTVNSSVGFEALLYGKEVYTLGANWYTHLTHRDNQSMLNFTSNRPESPLAGEAGRMIQARNLLASAIATGEMYTTDEEDIKIVVAELARADSAKRGIKAANVCAALNGA